MGQLSLTHILIIAILALIFFGPSRLPDLGKSIGKAIKGFKHGLNDSDEKDVQDSQLQSSNKTSTKDKNHS